ncbi:MAG: ABC transporter ATP-binding protein [Desulfurococcaceae archaeon TW002]
MSGVSLRNISVSYSGRKALKNINADFPAGSLSMVIGPNGSGKTTLLKTIAGLVNYSGNVYIGGRLVDNVPPNSRGVTYVPQNNALVPTLRVRWNVALGLIDRVRDARIIEKKIEEVTQLLGIRNLLDRYPKELSGGEARRVAIARALAMDSNIVLMDEPELSVDIWTWQIILNTILRMRKSGKTIILSTHNFEELMPYTDAVCLLHEGNAIFVGDPKNLETENMPLDVRAWLGSVIKVDNVECDDGNFCVALLNGYRIYAGSYERRPKKPSKALILPKHATINHDGVLKGKITRKIGYYAGYLTFLVDVNGYELTVTSNEDLPEGAVVSLKIEKTILLG